MAKDSAASPAVNGALRSSAAKAAAAQPRAARRVRQGDVPASLDAGRLESDRVARATTRSQTVQSLAVADLLHAPASSETLSRLQALIGGASPDERRALRHALAAAGPKRRTTRTPTPNSCRTGAKASIRMPT